MTGLLVLRRIGTYTFSDMVMRTDGVGERALTHGGTTNTIEGLVEAKPKKRRVGGDEHAGDSRADGERHAQRRANAAMVWRR